jgi:hypothetical protein
MIQNSVGNIIEILNLLDEDVYTEDQLVDNYLYLTEKWGEWEIIGENRVGLVIRYVDVGNALFSGLMITYMSLTVASFVFALLVGKLIFPLLSKMYKNANDEMVDMATLTSAGQIEEMAKSKKKEEWF